MSTNATWQSDGLDDANGWTRRNKNKELLVPRTLEFPKVMGTPPTLTLGARGAASAITNSIWVLAFDRATMTVNPVFSYAGDPVQAAGAAPDRDLVKNVAVTTTNAAGNQIVTFGYAGQKFELYLKSQVGNNLRLLVDGEFISPDIYNAIPSGDGGMYHLLVDFGSYDNRIITVELSAQWFGGIKAEPNATVYTVPGQSIRSIWLGDSITEGGQSGSYMSYSFPAIASHYLKWDCWNSGVGSTGYINTGSAGRTNFMGRLNHDVILYKPDVVVTCGGLNDEMYTAPDVGDAAKKYFNALRNALPDTEVIITSPFTTNGSPNQKRADITEELRKIAQQFACPFIDMYNGITYSHRGDRLTGVLGSWITGTGNVSSPQPTGNASLFISADGLHPGREGAKYIGEKMAREIHRIYSRGL